MKLKASAYSQPIQDFFLYELFVRFDYAHPHRGGADRLSFNEGLTPTDRVVETLHHGYHEVPNESLSGGIARAQLYISMHSFTPVFDGQQRDVEIGVLFDRMMAR